MIRSTSTQQTLGLLLAVLMIVPGCGKKGTNQGAVSGAVKLDGQLLEQGSILFTPIEGTTGVVSGGPIEKGRYQLSGAACAAVGGNRVEIRAVRKTGKMVRTPFGPPGEMVEELANAIPPQFNSASTLKVDIKPGDNTANFEVTSR
jgi:hypothetical protein